MVTPPQSAAIETQSKQFVLIKVKQRAWEVMRHSGRSSVVQRQGSVLREQGANVRMCPAQ